MAIIEICVDSLESALEASRGGADRLELCSALSTGGLTPSLGFLRAARAQVETSIHVMIRPRSGDFLYSAGELALMEDDIALARQNGADGVVFGLLTEAGLVDEAGTRALVACAGSLQVTFHRAFDLIADQEAALQTLMGAGVHRVLTSGGARTAVEGQLRLAGLVQLAGDRLEVMLGGGVRPDNIQQLARLTGAREFHAGLRRSVPSPMQHRSPSVHLGDPGVDDTMRRVVHAEDVRALKLALSIEGSSLTTTARSL